MRRSLVIPAFNAPFISAQARSTSSGGSGGSPPVPEFAPLPAFPLAPAAPLVPAAPPWDEPPLGEAPLDPDAEAGWSRPGPSTVEVHPNAATSAKQAPRLENLVRLDSRETGCELIGPTCSRRAPGRLIARHRRAAAKVRTSHPAYREPWRAPPGTCGDPKADVEPMIARSSAPAPASSPRPLGVVVPMSFAGDDAALVAALRENHPGAKAAFFQAYARHVERLVTHVMGLDRELADIVQDVFLNALRSLPQLEDAAALKPWLYRIATNTARKVLRSRTRRGWLRLFRDADDDLLVVEPVAGADQEVLRALRSVYEVLRMLPADESIAFALRFIEGMELTEVANACDVSLATVKRRIGRAERHFVEAARRRPELDDWLKGGSRWKNQ